MSVAITSANAAAAIHGCLGRICTGCGNTLKRCKQSRPTSRLAQRHRADHPCGSPTGTRAGARVGDDDRRGSALHEVPFHAVARLLRPPASTILTVVSVRLRCPWGLGTFDERDQRRMRIRERSVDRRPGRRTAATQRHRQGPTPLATAPMRARPLDDSGRTVCRAHLWCSRPSGADNAARYGDCGWQRES